MPRIDATGYSENIFIQYLITIILVVYKRVREYIDHLSKASRYQIDIDFIVSELLDQLFNARG